MTSIPTTSYNPYAQSDPSSSSAWLTTLNSGYPATENSLNAVSPDLASIATALTEIASAFTNMMNSRPASEISSNKTQLWPGSVQDSLATTLSQRSTETLGNSMQTVSGLSAAEAEAGVRSPVMEAKLEGLSRLRPGQVLSRCQTYLKDHPDRFQELKRSHLLFVHEQRIEAEVDQPSFWAYLAEPHAIFSGLERALAPDRIREKIAGHLHAAAWKRIHQTEAGDVDQLSIDSVGAARDQSVASNPADSIAASQSSSPPPAIETAFDQDLVPATNWQTPNPDLGDNDAHPDADPYDGDDYRDD
jgi:hypothetical protein